MIGLKQESKRSSIVKTLACLNVENVKDYLKLFKFLNLKMIMSWFNQADIHIINMLHNLAYLDESDARDIISELIEDDLIDHIAICLREENMN